MSRRPAARGGRRRSPRWAPQLSCNGSLLTNSKPLFIVLLPQVHEAIRADPSPKPKARSKPAEAKRWKEVKLTYEQASCMPKARVCCPIWSDFCCLVEGAKRWKEVQLTSQQTGAASPCWPPGAGLAGSYFATSFICSPFALHFPLSPAAQGQAQGQAGRAGGRRVSASLLGRLPVEQAGAAPAAPAQRSAAPPALRPAGRRSTPHHTTPHHTTPPGGKRAVAALLVAPRRRATVSGG